MVQDGDAVKLLLRPLLTPQSLAFVLLERFYRCVLSLLVELWTLFTTGIKINL